MSDETSLINPDGVYAIEGRELIRLRAMEAKPSDKVHREVALAFIENPQNLPEVNHKDGNKSNNTVANLEWVTHQQNASHAHRNGLVNHHVKLSQADVAAIRERYVPFSRKDGTSAIAKQYGMCPSHIWRIVANQKRLSAER